jgi:hypothetical protein
MALGKAPPLQRLFGLARGPFTVLIQASLRGRWRGYCHGDGMTLQAFVLSGSGHSGYGRGFSTSIAFATSTLSFKKRELRWEIIFGRLITIFAIMFCLDGLARSSPVRSPIRSMKSCCSACLRCGGPETFTDIAGLAKRSLTCCAGSAPIATARRA